MEKNIGIQIGVSKDAVDAYGEVVISILSVPHTDEKTKQIALKTLGRGLSCDYATITGCSVNQSYSKEGDV